MTSTTSRNVAGNRRGHGRWVEPFICVPVDPYLLLVAGVVRQAIVDASTGDTDALAWLSSTDALELLQWLAPADVPPDVLQRRLVRQARRHD